MCCFFYHHHGRRDGIKDKKLESTTLLVVGWYTIARSHQNLRPQKTRESSSSSSGDVVMMGCCHPKVILPSQTTTLSWWEVTKSCSMERTRLLDGFWGKMRLGSCRRAWCLHQLKGVVRPSLWSGSGYFWRVIWDLVRKLEWLSNGWHCHAIRTRWWSWLEAALLELDDARVATLVTLFVHLLPKLSFGKDNISSHQEKTWIIVIAW